MPKETVGGREIKAALTAAATWLERHREAIDALNVFPVPDGDTGLNMSLTLRAAADEAATSGGQLPDVAAAMRADRARWSWGYQGFQISPPSESHLISPTAADVALAAV